MIISNVRGGICLLIGEEFMRFLNILYKVEGVRKDKNLIGVLEVFCVEVFVFFFTNFKVWKRKGNG